MSDPAAHPTTGRTAPGPLLRAAALALIAAAAAAPTAGDLGGCGQQAALLDEEKFFAQKARLDCARCEECNLSTRACEAACAGVDPDAAFPRDCLPLVHDGEVCLRALGAAGCGDYAGYVADGAATTPTECAFCPVP